jgi:RHS repeat-associated protein
MKYSILAAAAAAFVVPRVAGAVNGPAPGGVTAETVKVPDAPGSVRGLVNDASVSAFTGQVSYQIPIALPGGPGGFAPKLALGYSGALGNGPLGIGWALTQVSVRRSLRLGVPSYTASDELELVGLGGPTLVAIGDGQYRAEGQGNAIRGVAVDGGFELIDAAGTHFRLGTSDASRLQSGGQVAEWLLERATDVAGHTIAYGYERRDGQLYLASIAWGEIYRADLRYEDRPDAVVSWRTGFRIDARRRLAELRLSALGALRTRVVLGYDESFALSRLATVYVEGADGTRSPTTTLSYAAAAVGQAQALTNTGGWSLGTPSISLFDVDKDGAMDLLRIDASGHRYRRNLGGSFGPEVALGNAPAIGMAAVRMLDLDGDSGAEMVTKSGATWRSFRIVNNAWTATDWPGSATLDLQSVAVADLNGDNRMDVLAASGSGISVWLGTASGFAPPRALPAISPSEPAIKPTTVQLSDLNGDGLADAIAIQGNGLLELRGRGDGTFERVGLVPYPWTGTTDPTQIRLADLNRDGLLDVVRVGIAQVLWYRGRPDGSFAPTPTVLTRPPGADGTTIVALADANGNGSVDVVWSSTSGMWALDLAGTTSAGLLVAIDNGLGKVQRFGYTPSTKLAWDDEAAGAPWAERMPVSIPVATTSTQELASGDPDRITALRVRDGVYEQAERRFSGFARSIQTFPGAGAADTIRLVTQFHAGRGADRALRGQVLSARTEDGAGQVYKLVENQVSALAIAGLPDDPRLRRAAITQTQTTTSEPGQASAVVQTRYAFDPEGRPIEERRDGSVALDGDETILRRTYTDEDPVTGVRDLVCDERVLDGDEALVSRTQRWFGDQATVAPRCLPGNGWVREELGYLASEDRWVSLKRSAYDAHGNPITVVAGGVERTIGYDPRGLHPISEAVAPAPGELLAWTAVWDDVAGTLASVTGPNGVTRRMTYDGLGRVTQLAVNDAPAHVHYRYAWVGPTPTTETFTFDGDADALAELPATWSPGTGWRHQVTLANGAGEQVLTAVQLDAAQWTVQELRRRDHRGRVTAITGAFGHGGALAGVVAPAGTATQTLAYDPLDRVIDQVLPTGSHKRVTYHALGATTAIDGLAPATTELDGQDRPIHSERAVNGVVEAVDARYDAAGRMRQLRVQGGAVQHDYTYDTLGRLIAATDPDVGPRTMAYDDGGHLVRSENAAHDVVTYAYDGAGRLRALDARGVANRYHYDAPRTAGYAHTGGQLAWVEEATGTVDLGYDAYGQLEVEARTLVDGDATITGREVTRRAPSGVIRQLDLGDGVVLPFHYDAAGRVTAVDGVWAVEDYSPAGVPRRERFANGVIERYERDLLERPTRVTIEHPDHAIYDVTASYHAFGALAALTDQDGVGLDHTASFGFDAAGRLTAATLGAYQFSYAYDGLSNLVQRTADGPTELGILAGTYQYRPEAPRRLAQIVGPRGAVGFAYDAAGRQTEHAGHHLVYDGLSQLVGVDLAGGGHVEHRYGYDGSRVATRAASGATTYWITPGVVVRGGARDHYVRVGDRLIGKITTTAPGDAVASAIARGRVGLAGLPLLWILALAWRARRGVRKALAANLALMIAMAGCGPTTATRTAAATGPIRSYYHQTYAAGPELTTDAAGALLEDRRSEPFGAAIDAYADGAVHPVDYGRDPINALNQFTDPDTAWSYHGARWFAPDTATWHTPDPLAIVPDGRFLTEPATANPFQYVLQNPILYWDPDGRDDVMSLYYSCKQSWTREPCRTLMEPPEQDLARPDPDKPLSEDEADQIEEKLGFDPNGLGQSMTGATSWWWRSYIAARVWSEAKRVSEAEYKGHSRGLNDEEDAFRHAYASFELARRTSDAFAKAAGDSHERSYANPHSERLMDLFNNHVGRKLARDPANESRSADEVIRQALRDGLLMTRPVHIEGEPMTQGKYNDYKK